MKKIKFKKSSTTDIINCHLQYITTKFGYKIINMQDVISVDMSSRSVNHNEIMFMNGGGRIVQPNRFEMELDVKIIGNTAEYLSKFMHPYYYNDYYNYTSSKKKNKAPNIEGKVQDFVECFIKGMNYGEYSNVYGKRKNRRQQVFN